MVKCFDFDCLLQLNIFLVRSMQEVKDELFPKFQTGESKSDNVNYEASEEIFSGDIGNNKIERFCFFKYIKNILLKFLYIYCGKIISFR